MSSLLSKKIFPIRTPWFLSRLYSKSTDEWKLPKISESGNVVSKEQEMTEIANKVGILKDDRPDVPVNWRRNKQVPEWKRQMFSLREKFHGEQWRPKKRLSRSAVDGIRKLKQYEPSLRAGDIAKEFKVSPEAIRRILKSKWTPSEEEQDKIKLRWERRGHSLGAFAKKPKKSKQTSSSDTTDLGNQVF